MPAQLNGELSLKFKFAVSFHSLKTYQKFRKNYGKIMKHPEILNCMSILKTKCTKLPFMSIETITTSSRFKNKLIN